MKLYQKIITGGLLIVSLAGLFGCNKHPNIKRVQYDSKKAITKVYAAGYQGSGIAAADMDGDGLVDLLSTDGSGNVFIHKNLGDNRFEQ